MSYKIVDKIIKSDQFSMTEKMVFIALASFANDDGKNAFPSYDSIAKRSGANKRTVMRTITSLIKKGALKKKTVTKNNINYSNNYKINLRFFGSDTESLGSDRESLGGSDRESLGSDRESPKPTIYPTSITQPVLPPIPPKGGNSDQGKDYIKNKFILPDGICKDTWKEFEHMRNKKKKPMTDRARSLIIEKLITINQSNGQCPNEILNQSILNCWTGVFPINQKNNKGYKNGIDKAKEEFSEYLDKKYGGEVIQ